jgi:hypothetical protein
LNRILGDSRQHPVPFADVPGKSLGFCELNGTLGVARQNLSGFFIDRIVMQTDVQSHGYQVFSAVLQGIGNFRSLNLGGTLVL